MTISMYLFALYHALFISPADYVQGNAVRIMYVHVPAAWMALSIYITMAISNIFYIICRSQFAAIVSYSAAPVGACFTFICLVTGGIWGKPIWGVWWAWDARMTSMLILFFLYIGYIVLWNGESRSSKSAAVFSVIGAINIPIIKFSVNFWNTLHQPASVLRRGGVTIDSAMLIPLLSMFCASICLSIIICVLRTKTLVNICKINRYI